MIRWLNLSISLTYDSNMKRAKFNIEKQDISEYPTNKQKFFKGTKLLAKAGIGISILLIIGAIFSVVNGALERRHEKANAEQVSNIVNSELSRWNEARSNCGIEYSVSNNPIDGKVLLSLDVDIPFSSLRTWSGSKYETQIKCFSEGVYGISLTDSFKFSEELTKLSNRVFLDATFEKLDGTSDSSGLWAVISSSSLDQSFSQKKDVITVSFMWSQP